MAYRPNLCSSPVDNIDKLAHSYTENALEEVKNSTKNSLNVFCTNAKSLGSKHNDMGSCDEKPNKNNKVNCKKTLKVYYTNSRSLGNKINDLRAVVVSERPDIVCITESWVNLKSKHLKSEYSIAGYKLFNTDRQTGRKGGGVLAYVNENLSCCIKNNIKSNETSETLWLEIGYGKERIVLGVVYRSPNLDIMNSKIIYDEISKASRYNKVCIVGDFNFRNIV